MILGTKARYAVMALVDIAKHAECRLDHQTEQGEARLVSAKRSEDGSGGERSIGGLPSTKPVTLADIAARQEISLAYLEQIFPKLKKANLVTPVRGPGGGYMLANPASETWILDIIEAVDESLKMTRCTSEHSGGCMSTKVQCVTHSLWAGLGRQIEEYLGGISLADVCERRTGKPRAAQPPELECCLAMS